MSKKLKNPNRLSIGRKKILLTDTFLKKYKYINKKLLDNIYPFLRIYTVRVSLFFINMFHLMVTNIPEQNFTRYHQDAIHNRFSAYISRRERQGNNRHIHLLSSDIGSHVHNLGRTLRYLFGPTVKWKKISIKDKEHANNAWTYILRKNLEDEPGATGLGGSLFQSTGGI